MRRAFDLGPDRVAIGLVGAVVAVGAVLLAAPARGTLARIGGTDALHTCVLVGELLALVPFVRAAFDARLSAAARRAWLRFTVAFAVWFAADVVWAALGSPPLSIADALYAAYFPLMVWGVWALPAATSTSRLRFLLDTSIIVLSGAMLVWYFVVAPTIGAGMESPLAALVNMSYPVGDLVLLFGACLVLFRESHDGGRRAVAWIAAAMVVRAAGDLLYGAQSLAGTYTKGSYTDLVWLATFWCAAQGAFAHRRAMRHVAGDASTGGAPLGDRTRELLPYAAVAIAYGTLAAAAWRAASGTRDALALAGTLVGAAVVFALVVARQVQAMRENAALARAAALRESEYRVSVLVRHSSDALLVVCHDGAIRFASPSAEAMFDAGDDGLTGRELRLVVAESARDDVATFLDTARAVGTARAVWRLGDSSADGADRYVEVVGTDLLSEPAVGGVVLNVRDVTERTTLENRLAHLAFHDPLTGLVNRTRFRDRVVAALDTAADLPPDDAPRAAVLFVDLDDFKFVNDSLGHAAGDELIKVVAGRLLGATRGCDTVARLGGDEFGVLLASVHVEREADVVAQRIVDALRRPVLLHGKEVYARASIGVALAPRNEADDADALLRHADSAMYHAKRSGKGRFSRFAGEMTTHLPEVIAVEADLHRALERDELFLEYQPIVSLRDEGLVGVEALVRWNHPDRGRVPPLSFIPVAEQTGLVVPIGAWVLREACRAAARWSTAFDDDHPFYVSVNIASRQLADPSLIDDVTRALDEAGLAPARLLLEITESAIVEDAPHTRATLDALKALGIRLAIDDFGTGYSSLAYLHNFPIDVLKIDRAFVDGLGRGESQSALARAVIALGEALGLDTVAEGVETVAQKDMLRTLGCRLGQGFGFYRPASPSTIDRLVREASPSLAEALVA